MECFVYRSTVFVVVTGCRKKNRKMLLSNLHTARGPGVCTHNIMPFFVLFLVKFRRRRLVDSTNEEEGGVNIVTHLNHASIIVFFPRKWEE